MTEKEWEISGGGDKAMSNRGTTRVVWSIRVVLVPSPHGADELTS